MVLSSMSQRKCIYTGLPAKKTDMLMPKEGGDEIHNWTNSVPCSEEYKLIKQKQQPTDLDIEAQNLFYQSELLRLKLQIIEKRIAEVQFKIRKRNNINYSCLDKNISKEEQIKQAYKEKEILDMVDTLDEIIANKLEHNKRIGNE